MTITLTCVHIPVLPGFTDDVLEYIRESVPKTMLADLKDSIKQSRSLNVQDKYGSTAVSINCTHCADIITSCTQSQMLSCAPSRLYNKLSLHTILRI